MTEMNYHQPVLFDESLGFLITNPSGIYFDATIGFGGHSAGFLSLLNDNAKLIGTDKDINAFNYCVSRFAGDKRVRLYNTGFVEIEKIKKIEFIEGFDGIFADLGVSSFQLDEADAGFTFRVDAPLDLRMDKTKGKPASFYLNTLDVESIANIIYQFGEEKKSRVIARKIVEHRSVNKIKRTSELKEIIEKIVPSNFVVKTLSRVFQALRIYVNNELDELKEFLVKSTEYLKPGGRLVVLSYHSLEDRIVKEHFKYENLTCICPPALPVCVCDKEQRLKILTKKPVVPTDKEIKENRRARSAKLRAAERV